MRFLVSRGTWVSSQESLLFFAYRAITCCGQSFQIVQLDNKFLTLWLVRIPARPDPATPE